MHVMMPFTTVQLPVAQVGNAAILLVLLHVEMRMLRVGTLAQRFAKHQQAVHLQQIQTLQTLQPLPLFAHQTQLYVVHIVVFGNAVKTEKYVEWCQ